MLRFRCQIWRCQLARFLLAAFAAGAVVCLLVGAGLGAPGAAPWQFVRDREPAADSGLCGNSGAAGSQASPGSAATSSTEGTTQSGCGRHRAPSGMTRTRDGQPTKSASAMTHGVAQRLVPPIARQSPVAAASRGDHDDLKVPALPGKSGYTLTVRRLRIRGHPANRPQQYGQARLCCRILGFRTAHPR